MRTRVWSLVSLSGLRSQRCCELWCRLQTWLRSHVAVAWAGIYSSNSTPSLQTSICRGCSPKKPKKKKNEIVALARSFFSHSLRGLLFKDYLHLHPSWKDCLWACLLDIWSPWESVPPSPGGPLLPMLCWYGRIKSQIRCLKMNKL